MSIQSVREALQAFHSTIDGVQRAPVEPQPVINAADCPFVLVMPEQADWTRHASRWTEVRRTWLVEVFVRPIAKGKLGDGVDATEQLLEAFGQAYMTDAGLTLNDEVAHTGDVSDEGVMVGEFAGVKYHGFKLRVVVTEKRSL